MKCRPEASPTCTTFITATGFIGNSRVLSLPPEGGSKFVKSYFMLRFQRIRGECGRPVRKHSDGDNSWY